MLNQNDIREKLQGLKGGVKSLWDRFHHKFEGRETDQADGIDDVDDKGKRDIYEFTPETKVSTSPRTKSPLSNGSDDAQNLVWDNEDASMQDKSYSFDEETTDADYEKEDSLNFEDDNESNKGQEGRYT